MGSPAYRRSRKITLNQTLDPEPFDVRRRLANVGTGDAPGITPRGAWGTWDPTRLATRVVRIATGTSSLPRLTPKASRHAESFAQSVDQTSARSVRRLAVPTHHPSPCATSSGRLRPREPVDAASTRLPTCGGRLTLGQGRTVCDRRPVSFAGDDGARSDLRRDRHGGVAGLGAQRLAAVPRDDGHPLAPDPPDSP